MSARTAAYRAGWRRGLVEFRQSLTDKGDLFSTLFWPLLMVVVLIFVRSTSVGTSGLLLGTLFLPSVIGMNVADQPLRSLGSVGALAAIALVLAGHGLSVYPLAALFSRSRWRLPASYQHALFWGGLRGALALALALAVPASVPERGPIIVSAFVAVAFSILVQGLTMPWLIRRFDLGGGKPRDAVAAEESHS